MAAAEVQQAAPDLAAFDRGFRAGQEEFNRKKYLDAARVWTNAAESLPETDEHQENRRAIYEYIAEAYEKALAGGGDDALMREGLSILDAYAEVFAAAHPTDTLPEHVIKTRLVFRIRLAKGAAQRQQQALPPTPPPAPIATSTRVGPPPRPWRGLAIGGGVAVAGGAAMLGVFAAGLAGGKSAESKFDDQANACDLNEPVGKCAEFDAQGVGGRDAEVDGDLGGLLAERRAGAQLSHLGGEGHAGAREVLDLDDGVDEAELDGLLGGEGATGQQDLVDARGGLGVGEAVDQVAAAEAGQHADGRLGLAEHGADGERGGRAGEGRDGGVTVRVVAPTFA